jgi:hypothetical protein
MGSRASRTPGKRSVLVDDGGDAGVGVLEIGGGIAVHGEGLFPGEGDGGLRILGEVGVFDGADADGAGDGELLVGGHVGGGGFDEVEGAAFRFVEEEVELDGGALARGEEAFGQAHEAEPDVAQGGLRAGLLREGEELAEVELLALVGDVEDGVGMEFGSREKTVATSVVA